MMQRVEKCLRAVRGVSAQIQPGDFFKRDLMFESIDVVDLIFELEQEFQLRLTMFDLHDYVLTELKNETWDFTVIQLCSWIQKKTEISQ